MKRLRLTTGDEYDHLTRGGKRVHSNNHSKRRKIKRRFRRKERFYAKKTTRHELQVFYLDNG